MARRRLVFEEEVRIWREGNEFVAEWDNGHQPNHMLRQNYYAKSDSVVSAVANLFEHLVEAGIVVNVDGQPGAEDFLRGVIE
jgi:hypothetical protein